MKFQSQLRIAALSLMGMAIQPWAQTGSYMNVAGAGSLALSGTASALTAWQIEGEYLGTIEGGGVLGAWIIARSSNRYDLILLPGGLVAIPGQPGGGWNGTTKYTGSAIISGTTYAITTANGYTTTSITGAGENRVLNGMTNDSRPFALNRVVRKSPTMGLKPKPEWGTAQSWFDSAAAVANRTGELAKWVAQNTTPTLNFGGYLYRGVRTSATHGVGLLHIEFMCPFRPSVTVPSQDRANSGIYLHSKYELQVLDSFGWSGLANETGAIYNVKAPIVNAALPPITLQTYDCYFKPRTSGANGDSSVPGASATMTVYLNGVLVQDSVPVHVTTEAGLSGLQTSAAGLFLQDHGNDIVFNNIWFIPNATRASLPYSTVLAAGTTAIHSQYQIKSRAALSDQLGLEGTFNAAGRKLSGQKNYRGRVLTFEAVRKD